MENHFKRLAGSVLTALFLLMQMEARSQPLKIKRSSDLCNPDSVEIGRRCPDFKSVDLSGLVRSVSDFRGNYVLILLRTTVTNSSRAEYPYFLALEKKYAHHPITFVDISLDKDKEDWEFYFRHKPDSGIHWYSDPLKAPLSYFLLKRKDRGERTFFSYTLPQVIMLDPRGRILQNKLAFPLSDTARLDGYLQTLPGLKSLKSAKGPTTRYGRL